MALQDIERITLRRAIGDYGAAEEIFAVIDGGVQATLSARTSKALQNALGEYRVLASVEAALEAASAVDALGKEACRRMMGSRNMGNNLVTELNAIEAE